MKFYFIKYLWKETFDDDWIEAQTVTGGVHPLWWQKSEDKIDIMVQSWQELTVGEYNQFKQWMQ